MLMTVPSFIRIERGSDGSHDFKLYNVPLFAQKPANFNVSRSAAPKLALVPASCYNCDIKQSNPKCLCQVLLGLKEVQMGAHDFKLIKVPLFSRNQ